MFLENPEFVDKFCRTTKYANRLPNSFQKSTKIMHDTNFAKIIVFFFETTV
jgi:hypothetical protein